MKTERVEVVDVNGSVCYYTIPDRPGYSARKKNMIPITRMDSCDPIFSGRDIIVYLREMDEEKAKEAVARRYLLRWEDLTYKLARMEKHLEVLEEKMRNLGIDIPVTEGKGE